MNGGVFMVYVKVNQEENFDQALKRFMRELKESGINEQLTKRRFYVKKTTKKRLQRKARDLKIKIANKYA